MPNDTISTLIAELRDDASRRVREQIERVADLDVNVLLTGETGSGKDLFAAHLQAVSRWPRLVNLHCGDVPEALLESEWFGYRRGAFSGADHDEPGRWQTAGDGILFLNGIDLLGRSLQAKLLRVIERRRYFPLGSNREEEVHARFLFAAGADLAERAASGEFRADLFYRIAAFTIAIPPLRERRGDILPLLGYFGRRHGVELALDARNQKRLLEYAWPGNLRELENLVTSASLASGRLDSSQVDRLLNGPARAFALPDDEPTLANLENRYIRHLLKRHSNRSRVAAILGISRKSLYNRLKRHETD
jgi:transcriptional regulator with PAS, ATPase and Fis domain